MITRKNVQSSIDACEFLTMSERLKSPKQRALNQPKSFVQYWPALAHFLFFSWLSRGHVRGSVVAGRELQAQRRKCARVLAPATDRWQRRVASRCGTGSSGLRPGCADAEAVVARATAAAALAAAAAAAAPEALAAQSVVGAGTPCVEPLHDALAHCSLIAARAHTIRAKCVRGDVRRATAACRPSAVRAASLPAPISPTLVYLTASATSSA